MAFCKKKLDFIILDVAIASNIYYIEKGRHL